MTDVPRLTAPNPADVRRDYFVGRRPVVLAGALAGSVAFRDWTPDYIRRAAGGRVVVAWYLPDGVVRGDPAGGLLFRRIKAPLADLIDRLERPAGAPAGCFYVAQRSLKYGAEPGRQVDIPELAADLPDLPVAAGRELRVANLWMSAGNPVTCLHYDQFDNVLGMIRGRKRIVLFPPSETRHLYPFPLTSDSYHLSRIDPDAPDPARFPLYRPTRGVEVEIGPGDALYIPAFWWHHVRSHDVNIAVNYWYRNAPGTLAGVVGGPSRNYYLRWAWREYVAGPCRAAAGRWLSGRRAARHTVGAPSPPSAPRRG